MGETGRFRKRSQGMTCLAGSHKLRQETRARRLNTTRGFPDPGQLVHVSHFGGVRTNVNGVDAKHR
jgi:hypothetical protein